MTPRTPKLNKLPTARPPIKQNCATVAAVLICSCFSLGLCSSEDACIMHMVARKPLDVPKATRMSMYRRSELISGAPVTDEDEREEGRATLQARKRGMKSVRPSDKMDNRRADQIWKRGKEQMKRPIQSPMLKTRKWRETKRMGEKNLREEFVWTERIELVIGGNIACLP